MLYLMPACCRTSAPAQMVLPIHCLLTVSMTAMHPLIRAWRLSAHICVEVSEQRVCTRAGVYVTVYLGSVFRAVLTVTLSGLIWALDIALFYSPLGHGVFGEPLDPQVVTLTLTLTLTLVKFATFCS